MSGLRLADSGGDGIAFELREGTGTPLVLVHGLGYGRSGWGSFAELVGAGRNLVLVDNRGIGDSASPPGPYTVGQLAADVAAVIEQAGLAPCDVLGASLGGMVALELAAGRPELVRRLVLLATTPGEPQGVPLPRATAALLRGEQAVDDSMHRRLIEGALARATVAGRPQVVDGLLELRASNPQSPSAWRAQAAASLAFSLRAPLGTIAVPALVLAGTEDVVIDPRNSVLLAMRLGRARGVILGGAGHLCFFDQPERCAAAVRCFVDDPVDPVDAVDPVEDEGAGR